jgi:hypothetical protein
MVQMTSRQWPVTCSNCGSDLADLSPGDPCLQCDSTVRTTHVSVSGAVTVHDHVSGLAVEYTPERPWQEQWRFTRRAYDALERAYAGLDDGLDDFDGWKALALDFCGHCYHLKDWLKNDPTVPATAQQKAESYARKSAGIALAGDVANTYKHRNRRPGQTVAHVAQVALSKDGAKTQATFRIDYTRPDSTTGSVDALELAKQALMEWRAFFGSHNLQP